MESYETKLKATKHTAKEIAEGAFDYSQEIRAHAEYCVQTGRAQFKFVKQYGNEHGVAYKEATLWADNETTVTIRPSDLESGQPDAMELPPPGTQHTQGELYVSQTGFIFTLNGGGALFEVVTPDDSEWTDEAKANAAHLVECWNGHDHLVAAVKSVLADLKAAKWDSDIEAVQILVKLTLDHIAPLTIALHHAGELKNDTRAK